jgi:hypothetical protein
MRYKGDDYNWDDIEDDPYEFYDEMTASPNKVMRNSRDYDKDLRYRLDEYYEEFDPKTLYGEY